jgi:hypothetical protein
MGLLSFLCSCSVLMQIDWGGSILRLRGGCAMKTKTYFAFRVDVWDGAGDSVVEHVAGVDDFETAVATLLGRRPTMAKGEDHAAPGSTGGGEELAGSSLTKISCSRPTRFNSRLSPIAEKGIDVLSNSVGPSATRVAL